MNESFAASFRRRLAPSALCLSLLAGVLCPGQAGTAKRDESERFFSHGVIPHLRIDMAQTNLAKLRRNARNYIRATVKEGDKIYEEVGIHLKGAAGSFRGVDDAKPAFTLNFDKFVDGQNFHGIDKLSLNNSVQDQSYMTEAICSELFLAAGVPTPRTTHARVELNGRDLGFYVLKEGFDKTFLKRHFSNVKGNLYDGGFLREITESLERTSGDGDVRGRADLKALASAAQESDRSSRFDALCKVLDVDRFLSFAALEMLTWHWDGYVMKKNNYRIYHDPDADRMVFLPHGMDQMFWQPNGTVIPRASNVEGLIARAVLETPEGRRLYRERAASLLTNVFTVERLTNHINQLHARIRPVLQAISREDARNFDDAVNHLRNAVTQRVRVAAQKLFEPEAQPVRFDPSGVATLTQWQTLDIRNTGKLDQPALVGSTSRLATASAPNRTEKVNPAENTGAGIKTLHIKAGPEGRCTASWRQHLVLRPGSYVFEGRVRTAGVVPLEKDVNTKGKGAGIRQSQQQPRKHGLVGDNDWQTVEYEFEVTEDAGDVTLLCELRAEKGEAWFDLASLKLRRK
jgi:hypothetical protein